MIRKILDESLLHHIIMETINDYLNEDGAMGGGATAGATSDSADRQGAFDVPFGGVQRRNMYKTSNGMTSVDMSPALKRHDGSYGSISIPKRRK